MTEPIPASTSLLTNAAIESISQALQKFVRSHYGLIANHDDLVQQGLSDLLDWLAARPLQTLVNTELTALAITIIKRRVADQYRTKLNEFANVELSETVSGTLSVPSTEHVVSYRQLLAVVLKAISNMTEVDRVLLLEAAQRDVPKRTMSDNERQRLHRLRAQLRLKLQEQGISMQDMREY